jgi:hypothetical protein
MHPCQLVLFHACKGKSDAKKRLAAEVIIDIELSSCGKGVRDNDHREWMRLKKLLEEGGAIERLWAP